jgi:DNA (cytosine-5)-methyltransferase 1
MVFDEVCADLENLGYQVAPFIIPASAVNAPHQRERVWFVAYCNGNGLNQRHGKHEEFASETGFDALNDVNENDERWDVANSSSTGSQSISESESEWNWQNGEKRIIANTDKERLQCARESTELGGIRLSQCDTQNYKSNWQNFPTQSPICSRDDGLPSKLDRITFSKWRNESIKAYGNAIVPQVVYQIFKAIEEYESKG